MTDAENVAVLRVGRQQPARDRGDAPSVDLHGGRVILDDVHDPRMVRCATLRVVPWRARRGYVGRIGRPLSEGRAEHRVLAPLVCHLRQIHLADATSDELVANVLAELRVPGRSACELIVHALRNIGVVVHSSVLQLHAQRACAAIEVDCADPDVV